MKKRLRLETAVVWAAAAVLLAGAVFAGVRAEEGDAITALKCVSLAAAMFAPYLARRFWKVQVPLMLTVFYAVFAVCAIFLGNVLSFYSRVPHWDSILHFASGIGLVFFGFWLGEVKTGSAGKAARVASAERPSVAARAWRAFCFAVALGALWEIFEFTMDGLLGLSAQAFVLESGELLAGRAALMDTMKDIILNTAGAGLAAVGLMIRAFRKTP
jgi:hypothetical protein